MATGSEQPKRAVFKAAGGAEVVRWVLFAEPDRLGVTDDAGLQEWAAAGETRFVLWVAPELALYVDKNDRPVTATSSGGLAD